MCVYARETGGSPRALCPGAGPAPRRACDKDGPEKSREDGPEKSLESISGRYRKPSNCLRGTACLRRITFEYGPETWGMSSGHCPGAFAPAPAPAPRQARRGCVRRRKSFGKNDENPRFHSAETRQTKIVAVGISSRRPPRVSSSCSLLWRLRDRFGLSSGLRFSFNPLLPALVAEDDDPISPSSPPSRLPSSS